jgi:NAD(P)-dependent dehydrogenase (short-subunit alcohol dehydrogenase family)
VTVPLDQWAVILGGSSGFGLAAADKLAAHGVHCFVVHRDRRGAMARIEPEFERIRRHGTTLVTVNADALDTDARERCLAHLAEVSGGGRVRVLLHSIAFGNLKLLVPERRAEPRAVPALAAALGVEPQVLTDAANRLFADGVDALAPLADPPAYPAHALLDDEDFARTIHSMGTNLATWARALLDRGLFAPDARVLGLTSEGNTVAWKGYAAVAAAKAALESVARAMAVELAPYGVRTNVIQAGITDTPALRAIPGHEHLAAQARRRNPFGRLTTPDDVADAIWLLATDEAAWINGALIRVDGGEHVAGGAG